jgi:hypothetical protein
LIDLLLIERQSVTKGEKYAMKKTISVISLTVILFFVIIQGSSISQDLPGLKLKDKYPVDIQSSISGNNHDAVNLKDVKLSSEGFQLKKRKTVSSYFGAGYSFMIFTNGIMSDAFPVLNTRDGNFLTNINLFFGFAIARAVTLEFEPTILFTSNNKQVNYPLENSSTGRKYAHTYTNGIIALPLAINVRFFPMYKLKTFARLFFIGGGVGAAWIREENDVFFNDNPTSYGINNDQYQSGISTSQWAPVFKGMIGFTGTGGQFGFGGELRYNIIPLKQDKSQPFATRFAKDFNSVDITLRFYFSL